MNRTFVPLLSGVIAANILLAGAAYAGQIEEVIVTATRRAADIQEVPISISSYSGDFITDSGVDSLQDLSLYAPNFTFATSSQPSNARIIIRGIGSAGNSAIEPAVGVFIDGVYYPRPGSLLGNIVDMQAVEVLRGPQGTLFGRNTAAGALNMRSNDPGATREGSVQAAVGDYGTRSLQAVLSTPIADDASARIAARWSERDGYGFNSESNREIGERDDLTVRGKLLVDVNEQLSIKLTADYNEINSGGNVIELDPATTNPVFEGTLRALFGSTALTEDGLDYTVHQDHQDTFLDDQWGVSADASYSFGDFTLRSITAFRNGRQAPVRVR